MCKILQLPAPFKQLDIFLNEYINPDIKEFSIQDKRGSSETYSSLGVSITLQHNINAFYAPEKVGPVTLGNINPFVLSELTAGNPMLSPFVENIVATTPNLPTQENNIIGPLKTPQQVQYDFTNQSLQVTYRVFSFAFEKKAAMSIETKNQFLYFKTLFLKADLGIFRETDQVIQHITSQYTKFLYNILLKCNPLFVVGG
ncbi:MAG: hypothetical protein WC511_01680 [Candidatus Pacearchaeota archaeon]